MYFQTTDSAVTSTKMILLGNGNLGVGQTSPSGRIHITSTGITAAAPSLGWPVYNAESDTNSRSIYIDTGGNNNVSTAGQGPTVSIQLGSYWDSRVVITPTGNGGSSPADQGTGRGKDLMLKAGTSDNGAGYKGGRLYLNGGMGYQSAFNANGGDIIMQGLTGSGNVGIKKTPSSSYALDVSGSVQATSYFESSDMRLKTLVEDIIDYSKIAMIESKYYIKEGKKELGYFAQDFIGIFDSAISKREDGYLDLSYRQIHTAKIAQLEKEIAELKSKLNGLGR